MQQQQQQSDDACSFQGFGSPVGSQIIGRATEPDHMDHDTTMSPREMGPLLFRRTPGLQNTPPVDSGKRFSDWVVSTSPFAGQKTPPTASMKSVAPGAADENTPPGLPPAGGNSNAHFLAWLQATGSTKWTPRRSPGAATPPAAPAPTPTTTPMSIMAQQLPASAASPATAEPRSRPIFDLGGSSSSSDDEDDETNTTVGVQQVAAGAERMRAALAAADGGAGTAAQASQQPLLLSPPPAPAPTPSAIGHPVASGVPDAAQLLQQAADSLASPMSLLGVSSPHFGVPASHPRAAGVGGAGGSSSQFGQQTTPGTGRHLARLLACQEPPASPVDKVIGLMLEPVGHDSGHHHHHAAAGHGHHGATRLAKQPPASPEQQLIQLMMRDGDDLTLMCGVGGRLRGAAAEPGAAQSGAGPAAQAPAGQQQGSAGPARSDGFVDALSDAAESTYSSCVDDDDYGGDSFSSSESGDEIDVAELQELCGGEAVAAGTPISDIINMMLSPELKGAAGLTPAAAADQHGGDDGVGPRVLFADD